MRQVTLVTGPPCAGKTWYATHHAQPDDLVLCIDRLARKAGSTRQHNHTGSHYGRAERAYQQRCAHIRIATYGTAWVLRCAPTPAERAQLARQVRATRIVVLLPPKSLAIQRAYARDGDSADRTVAAIRSWYARYQPGPNDRTIRR